MTASFLRTFPQDLLASFYSAAFYVRLWNASKGWGIRFVLACALVGLIHAGTILAPLSRLFTEEIKALCDALPAAEIHGGSLKIDAPTPWSFELMKTAAEGPYRVLIDLDADAADETDLLQRMEKERIIVLATRHKYAVYEPQQKKIRLGVYDLQKDVVMDHADWTRFADNLASFFLPFSLVGLGGLLFFSHLSTALLGGALLALLAPLFKVRSSLSAAVRVASAAKFPVTMIALVAAPDMPLQVLVWLGFSAFGLLAVRRAGADKVGG